MKIQTNKNKVLGLTAIVFLSAYMLLSKEKKLSYSLINALFILGAVYTILGMCTYIRNVGLFKTFRYFSYKISNGAYSKKNMGQIKFMNLAEFTEEIMKEKNHRSGKQFYLWGIPMLVISYLLVLTIK